MSFNGILQFPSPSTETPKISLREAAKKTHKTPKDKTKCSCTGTCQRGRCSCRSVGYYCSSHCHPKNRSCLNRDDDVVVTKIEKYDVVPRKLEIKSSQGETLSSDTALDGASVASILAKRKRKLMIREQPESRPAKIKKKEDLSKRSLKLIRNCSWLEDDHIDAANFLLKKQFPELLGLYPPTWAEDLSFPTVKYFFIQIINVNNQHWVTVAGFPPSLVHVYDSVYDYVSETTKMQVATIMCSAESSITFKLHKIQFQQGTSDCGAFAIAYAADLAYGNDPASFRYKQDELRPHLLDCLEKKILLPFPKADTFYPRKPKLDKVSIFCLCRLPDNGEEKMACCVICDEWYHKSCENIPKDVFKSSKKIWKCSKCN